jgi:hypothetical protein
MRKRIMDLFVEFIKKKKSAIKEKILITFMKIYELEGREMDFLDNYTRDS